MRSSDDFVSWSLADNVLRWSAAPLDVLWWPLRLHLWCLLGAVVTNTYLQQEITIKMVTWQSCALQLMSYHYSHIMVFYLTGRSTPKKFNHFDCEIFITIRLTCAKTLGFCDEHWIVWCWTVRSSVRDHTRISPVSVASMVATLK